MDLNILYEDNHLIVVEKLPGVLSQPATLNLPDLLTITKDYIKIKYNKPGNVFLGLLHRLDTNVGGVMVFAKTSKGASRVSKEIRAHRFIKKYLVIVEGVIKKGTIVKLTDYLGKDEKEKKAFITTSKKGKESILDFKSLAVIDNKTLLEVNLVTGRFHQIRAQLANYKTPIYGDTKYGSNKEGIDLALYAYLISFKHPTLEKDVIVKHYPKIKLFEPFLNEANLI